MPRVQVSSHTSSCGSSLFIQSAALVAALWTLLLCVPALGQEHAQATAGSRPLITQAIDESQLTALKGNTHPLARPEFDLGTAPATLPMERMLFVLKRSPEQDAALTKLLDDQQDKASPNYHKWLTPEEFGKQFGPTDTDMQTITLWLQSHGFQVGSSKGRTVLEFSGSASQVQEAFHTTIHKYIVNGEQHWANASDPQIPTALVGAVAGVRSLNNFPRKAMHVLAGMRRRDPSTGKIEVLSQPEFTFPNGCVEDNFSQAACANWLGPYDFATIYNVVPLWNAGINGTGVTIAIVGETDIQTTDVEEFRSMFGLPANDPVFVLNGPDPGIQPDETEADLDVQWSGAVAPAATIDFVISESTETTSGVDLSAVYIVDQNLAPIMSESYGECELGIGTAGNQFYNALWQQASAEGITVFISAGDGGSAGCDNFDLSPPAPARYGLQVSGYASTPYNVAVGGTDFNELDNPGTYWNTTNNPTTLQSVKSYIPETTWNDSCTNYLFGTVGFSNDPETNCNNSQLVNAVDIVSGSGGASKCTNPSGNTPASCAGGYSRPNWQTGSGTFSTDGKRDIPDVSLFASNGFVGTAFTMCQADVAGQCRYGNFLGIGGTSASSPAFAGIMALVVQGTGERQGNANYILYKLAQKTGASCTSAASEASSCIFNDVDVGVNTVPCATGTTNCVTKTSGHLYGVLSGYTAVAGYDMATGLGSVNANNLVTQWNSVSLSPSTTTLSIPTTTITHGQSASFTATVKPQTGSGTPTGTISLEGSPSNSTQGIAGFNLSNGTVTANTDMLPGGTYSVIAHYPGDATYASSDSSPVTVTVNKENSQSQVFLVTFNSSGQIISGNATTAQYGSPYLLRVNVENASGQMCQPVATSGATACPTGSVALTANGTALDLGTYTLNSNGYFEDQLVQLTGGVESVKAVYAGDNSFNTSSVTNTFTITQAPTTISGEPYVFGAAVGQPAAFSVTVFGATNAAAPSGTVTFYANGTALGGTMSYNQVAGASGFQAYTQATLNSNTNAFPATGNYAITATYNGDANYSSSTSPTDNISVMYPIPNVVTTPYSQTVNYGGTASIGVLIDTVNKTAYPTGTVTFVDPTGATVATPTCTKATDSSGNFACQVVGTFSVVAGGSVLIKYSGDSNYPANSSGAYIAMPDFQIYPEGIVQVTAGQSQDMTVLFSSSNGFTGTLSNLACSGLPAETTCTFNPPQVTVPGNGSVSTTMTVATTAIGMSSHAESRRARIWGAAETAFLFGACLIAIPLSRRRGRIPIALILVAVLIMLPSCGGGSAGGGGGSPNPVPSISSLSPTQVAAGSQITLLLVNGTNFMNTSSVTYNGTLHNSSFQSATQLAVALGPNDVATTCQCAVVVTNPGPGGGPSTPSNFKVLTGTPTGNFNATLTGVSGPITHNVSFPIIVQ